jgi:hypothetical protein
MVRPNVSLRFGHLGDLLSFAIESMNKQREREFRFYCSKIYIPNREKISRGLLSGLFLLPDIAITAKKYSQETNLVFSTALLRIQNRIHTYFRRRFFTPATFAFPKFF